MSPTLFQMAVNNPKPLPPTVLGEGLTFPGWGLFLLVGEVGLISAGGTKVPSKSLEYMLLNRAFPWCFAADGGCTNIPEDEMCLLFIALADFTLSFVISWTSTSGPGGVSLAFAECDLGLLSRVLGLLLNSDILPS